MTVRKIEQSYTGRCIDGPAWSHTLDAPEPLIDMHGTPEGRVRYRHLTLDYDQLGVARGWWLVVGSVPE